MSDEILRREREALPGVFPDCGCHYTNDDDGIHFCRMHAAASDLLRRAYEAMEYEGIEHKPPGPEIKEVLR